MLQVWEGSDCRVMGESRLIAEELLALCLQRITMEENTVNTEQGETDLGTVYTLAHTRTLTWGQSADHLLFSFDTL